MSTSWFLEQYQCQPPKMIWGHTTCQMLIAPKGAVYVWLQQYMSYPRDLARYLGRDDLTFQGPSWLNHVRNSGPIVILDHATVPRLTKQQWITYCEMILRQRESYAPDAFEKEVPPAVLGHGLFSSGPDRSRARAGGLRDRHLSWPGCARLERAAPWVEDQLL